MSQAELAKRADRPEKTISEIVAGKTAITPETALDFERVLGVPARFWNNLERNYKETKARLEFEKTLASQTKHLTAFPYGQMAKLGWVRETRSRSERVAELLSFFGVSSLNRVHVRGAAFRVGRRAKASESALAAWLRKGELEARHMRTEPYEARGFEKRLADVRSLTRRRIESSQHQLRDLCTAAGVAVVFVPHLPRTYANGATRWLTSTKAMIQLSLRYAYDDVFWFSFFHEAAHILKHGKRTVFVEGQETEETEEEREADQFAADHLIPPKEYRTFSRNTTFSGERVKAFAERIGVSPSIVVGRLQHDELLPRTHLNGLRSKFAWATER